MDDPGRERRREILRMFKNMQRTLKLITSLGVIMADQLEELSAKLEETLEKVRLDEEQDDANETMLKDIIADLKAHPPTPDLTAQIRRLDDLQALLHGPVGPDA